MKNPVKRQYWITPERLAWLRAHYSEGTVPETLEKFNAFFGTAITYSQLRSANKNRRIGTARSQPSLRRFTDAEKAWLKRCLPLWPRRETRQRFHDIFGWWVTLPGLDYAAKCLNAHGAPRVGQFQKGNIPPNQGRKGYCPPGCEKSWFRKGTKSVNTLPLYTERWRRNKSKLPILCINLPVRNPYTGAQNHWVSKGRWVWEKANGPVPAGHVIFHLDRDPSNCALENLECIPRSTLAVMNRWTRYAGKDANAARLRLAQLRQKIAEAGK